MKIKGDIKIHSKLKTGIKASLFYSCFEVFMPAAKSKAFIFTAAFRSIFPP